MGRMALWALVAVGVAVAALAAWVRLAPSDPARWHIDPARGVSGANAQRAEAAVPLPPAAALGALDAVAMAWPRTQRLAGSPAEGRITYITRTRLMGFPDYTTVAALPAGEGSRLVLFARARFGQSDLGVNAARVAAWLAALPGAGAGGGGP